MPSALMVVMLPFCPLEKQVKSRNDLGFHSAFLEGPHGAREPPISLLKVTPPVILEPPPPVPGPAFQRCRPRPRACRSDRAVVVVYQASWDRSAPGVRTPVDLGRSGRRAHARALRLRVILLGRQLSLERRRFLRCRLVPIRLGALGILIFIFPGLRGRCALCREYGSKNFLR